MSVRLLRSVCTAALAAAVVVAPATPAGADPVAPPAPMASTPAVSTPTASAAPKTVTPETGLLSTAPGPSSTAPTGVVAMLTELQRLYQQAEESAEAYNATAEQLARQRAETKRVGSGLTRARAALAHSRGEVGRLARQQYQGRSELSGYLALLLADDPQHALDGRHLLERAARARVATLARLTTGEKRADGLATKSRRALDAQQTLAAKQRRLRDTGQARLRQVERMLATLSPAQLAALTELERTNTDKAQQELVTSGALGEKAAQAAPSAEGEKALRYAVGQIGKPYEWGAEGPESYDCSGLTSQAWAGAGLTIPRTSQEQWRQLPRVPLSQLRPGDLVIYYPKATHVALYLGDGRVVQAPRPGSRVKVSPLAANPLLGAVRPDPQAAPLPAYSPPELPAGATEGSDLGLSSDARPGTAAGAAPEAGGS